MSCKGCETLAAITAAKCRTLLAPPSGRMKRAMRKKTLATTGIALLREEACHHRRVSGVKP
jgi:hypothetical protein